MNQQKMNALKSISIGIPTLNRQPFLLQTISSIIDNCIAEVIEIIIVDQSSDKKIIDQNKILFNNYDLPIKYLLLNEPSVCKARNLIILESIGDIIYFIDDDVLLSKNTIYEHLILYTEANVVSTLGKIYNRNSNTHYENLNILKPSIGTHENFPNDNFINYNFKGSGVSCNQTYLRSVLLDIKGFDENFAGGYFEDADIVNRIKQKGYKIGFNPKAYLLHIKAPMGGLRFDKIQPINAHIKFYSFLFYFIRYAKINSNIIKDFYKVLRAGPLKKENIFSYRNGLVLWLKLPFLIYKSIKNKHTIKSIIN